MMTTTQYFHSGHFKQAYQILNRDHPGLPLVMVMGLSGVKEDWHPLAADLAQNRPVLIFDNRGVGESDVPEGPYTIAQMAKDTLALMQHIGWPQSHLMGISMGGMIAQQLLITAGTQFDRAILGCTHHGGPSQILPDPETYQAFQSNRNESKEAVVKKMVAINVTEEWIQSNPKHWQQLLINGTSFRRPARGIRNQLMGILQFHVAQQLSAVTNRCLVIHGSADKLIPFENGRLIAEKLPNSQFIELKDAGHQFWVMEPRRSFETIDQFLSEE